jgi:hypothetical protein
MNTTATDLRIVWQKLSRTLRMIEITGWYGYGSKSFPPTLHGDPRHPRAKASILPRPISLVASSSRMLRAALTSRFQKLALQALLAQRRTFLFFRNSNSPSSLVASRRAFSSVWRPVGFAVFHSLKKPSCQYVIGSSPDPWTDRAGVKPNGWRSTAQQICSNDMLRGRSSPSRRPYPPGRGMRARCCCA